MENSQPATISPSDVGLDNTNNELNALKANSRLYFALNLYSSAAGVIGVVVGFVVLIGWAFDIASFKSILPGFATMKPNTAASFILSGASLYLWQTDSQNQLTTRIAKALAFIVALIGLLTLSQYLFGWNLKIDQLIFKVESANGTNAPGRMAPVTAFSVLLTGVALFSLEKKNKEVNRLSQWIISIVTVSAVMSIIGYAYGVEHLYEFEPFSSVALHTAITFFILSMGVIFVQPHNSILAIVLKESAGGKLARVLLPTVFFIPFIGGWFRLQAQQAGYIDTELGLAIFVSFNVAVFTTLVLLVARSLDKTDTELKQISKALLEKQEQIAGIIGSAMDAIITIDDEQHIVLFNSAAEVMFRCSSDKALGKPLNHFIPARFREIHKQHIEEFGKAKTTKRSMGSLGELFGLRADGEEFPIEASISQLELSGKKFYTVILRDITERVRAEENLRASEQRFRALIENSSDSIALFGIDGAILYASPSTPQVLGYTSEEIMKFNAFDLIHKDDHKFVAERLATAMSQPKVGVGVHARVLHKDGSWRWLEGIFTNLLDEPNISGIVNNYRDVTERKRAEEAFIKSHEQLCLLVEQAPISIAMFDCDMRYIATSRRWIEEYGRGYDDLVGYSHYEIHPDMPEQWKEIHKRGLAGELLKNDEDLWVQADGSKYWLRWAVHPWRNTRGEIGGIIISAEDITEHKRAEDALRASEARFSVAFNASPISSVIATLDEGRYVAVNDTFLDITGYKREEVIGRASAELKVWPTPEARAEVIQLLKTQGQIRNREIVYRMKNGESRVFLTSAEIIELDGQPHLITASVDITERKQAEEALHESESRLQTILENLTEGVAVSDLDGHLLYINRAAVNMHGFTTQDECRGHFTEFTDIFERSLMDGTILPVSEWPLARILRGENLREWDLRVRNINLKWEKIFSYGGTLVHDVNGQPMLAVVTISDITERIMAAEQIRHLNETLEQKVIERTEQLNYMNKELEAFSYSVSHDLRAPLRAINGFSQAVLEDYEDKLDEDGKFYFQEIRGASKDMAQLIDDVLELSRVSRSEMESENVNLSDMANGILTKIKQRDSTRKVVVNIEQGLLVQGDQRLLKIMLTNLLENAWKFTSKREDAEIVFGHIQKEGEIIYFVRDNGAGFDMAYSNKLFGVFQRLHSTKEFEGTGIGLATVQRIVHRHGGRVWAEAEVNQGATFYFTLADFKEAKDG